VFTLKKWEEFEYYKREEDLCYKRNVSQINVKIAFISNIYVSNQIKVSRASKLS